jgi:hypothetical protein
LPILMMLKLKLLGVSEEVLMTYGAVSKQVAIQMAEGVRRILNSDIGVSTTGIAGPGGGTEDKPVGLVWMGFSIQGNTFALQAILSNNRLINKERTTMVVLECIRRRLLGLDGYPYELKPYSPLIYQSVFWMIIFILSHGVLQAASVERVVLPWLRVCGCILHKVILQSLMAFTEKYRQ